MSPLKTALIVAVASSLLTSGAMFLLNHRRAREAGFLRWQNNQLRMQAIQRQAETTAMPAPERGAIPAAAPNATATPAATSKPTEVYRNEGQATPLATLQTFAWACDRGDTESVGRLLHLDPRARTKAEAYLAALPDEVRKQWKTVDEMAAALLTRQAMAVPFPSADILATATTESVSADRVLLNLPGTLRSCTEYLKTDSGWKYVITEQMAADYIKRASQKP